MSHGFGNRVAQGPSGYSGMSGISGFSGFSAAAPLYGPFSRMVVGSSVSLTNNGGGETTLLSGTIIGSKIIPANTFTVGKSLRWAFWGRYDNQFTVNTMTFRFKLGSVTLSTTQTINSSSDAISNKVLSIEGHAMCLTTGASGTFTTMIQSYMWLTAAATSAETRNSYTTSVVVDTTVDNTIDFTVAGLSSTSQVANLRGGYVELLG